MRTLWQIITLIKQLGLRFSLASRKFDSAQQFKADPSGVMITFHLFSTSVSLINSITSNFCYVMSQIFPIICLLNTKNFY